MISKPSYTEAFVWVWLPGVTSPVVAGRLEQAGPELKFTTYGQSYLERTDRISIYNKELPLKVGKQGLLPGLNMPGCIRDGSPDTWGRRVIINKKWSISRSNATR